MRIYAWLFGIGAADFDLALIATGIARTAGAYEESRRSRSIIGKRSFHDF